MRATIGEVPDGGREGPGRTRQWDLRKMPRPLARGDDGGARAAPLVA
jgi:hypothetical protein